MNEQQSQKNWEAIPHMRIGQIPEAIMNGPINVVSLLVAKRCLMEVHEDSETDPEQGMKDAVANFMVLCAHLGLSFESILDSARVSFSEETSPNEIVSGPERSTRRMPGHYHLEFAENEELDEEGEGEDEGRYINGSIEECMAALAATDRRLVKACFICQYGCGMDHALKDNERVLLGVRPQSPMIGEWGDGSGTDMVKDLLTQVRDAQKPQ